MDTTPFEPLYTAAQARALDHHAINSEGIPGITLMARAAHAAFEALLDSWPEPGSLQVLCGTGNNGGDGFLLADIAHKRGLPVTVVQVGDPGKIGGDALLARQQAEANGVVITPWSEAVVASDGVIVDALLGTGLGGDVRGEYGAAIAAINHSGCPVLAVDVPSGLCADTGRVLGAAVRADVTVTFIGLKRGLFTGAAADHCGDIVFADLQVPAASYEAVPADSYLLELAVFLDAQPPRAAASHKGSYGTVLVVGGDHGMAGACALAAEAALRCGAGLVAVATRPEHVGAIVARTPEAMPRGVESGADLAPLLAAADVVVIGPGLGQSEWSRFLLATTVAAGKPMVLDADALNLLAVGAGALPRGTSHVFTPHPGEAARLLGVTTAEVQADRFAAAGALQQRLGGAVLLKGSGTLVAGAGELLLSNYGNPGMASGGMGDVLSGVIGALLAQGYPAAEAAAFGACLHGAAADLAAEEGMRGLLASDLAPWLRELLG